MVESRSQRKARIAAKQSMDNDDKNEFPDVEDENPSPDHTCCPPVPDQPIPNNATVHNNPPIHRNPLVLDLNPDAAQRQKKMYYYSQLLRNE